MAAGGTSKFTDRIWQRVCARLLPPALRNDTSERARQARVILAFWLVAAVPWPLIFAGVYTFALGSPAGGIACLAALGRWRRATSRWARSSPC